MIKKAKVIVCLYAGIVAASAMDENVIERETPDSNEKVTSHADLNTIISGNPGEEREDGFLYEGLGEINNQNQAPSTVATIRNANNDANKQNKTLLKEINELKEVLDEPEETPDSNEKVTSHADLNTIISGNPGEEREDGFLYEGLGEINNQNQAPSTVATIRNANNDANKQNKTLLKEINELKEVLDKPEAPSIFSAVKEVNNAGYKQNKIAIKEVDFDKISQRSKANIKINPHERIYVSKYITIKGEYAQHFYTITGLKINERELRKEGKHITIDYDILGKTQDGQTYISPRAFSKLKSDYLRINLNFLPLDGTNVVFPKDCSELFADSTALREVNFCSAQFFADLKATSAKYMFKDCANLHRITFCNFNTGRITDMSYMFAGCRSLKVLDLSKFNTSNVTDMEEMFANCGGLEILNLSHFNTENVTNMSYMFGGCFALKKLDISCFCTSNVQNMSYMFYACALENLDLSHFNTEKVENMEGMFAGCSQIKTLNFGGVVNKTLKNTIWMFNKCVNLVQLDLSGFKNQFNNEQTTKDFKLSNFDDEMFTGCTGLSKANKNRTVKAEQCVLDYIEEVLLRGLS